MDPQKPKGAGGDKQDGNQEDTLPGHGQHSRTKTIANGLGAHIAHGQKTAQGQSTDLEPQSQCADGDNFRIPLSEEFNNMAGKQEDDQADT